MLNALWWRLPNKQETLESCTRNEHRNSLHPKHPDNKRRRRSRILVRFFTFHCWWEQKCDGKLPIRTVSGDTETLSSHNSGRTQVAVDSSKEKKWVRAPLWWTIMILVILFSSWTGGQIKGPGGVLFLTSPHSTSTQSLLNLAWYLIITCFQQMKQRQNMKTAKSKLHVGFCYPSP